MRLLVTLVVFCSIGMTTTARAATFTVTKLADTNDGVCDSDCSLREGIQAANTTLGDDTIDFAPSVRGTIMLEHGLLLLHTNIVLRGPGAKLLTVRPAVGKQSKVFFNGDLAIISGLTVSHGYVDTATFGVGGGGIENDIGGNLTLRDCIVRDNAANVGAGLVNAGNLLVENCSFINNTATVWGGGLYLKDSRLGGL